MTGKVKLFIVVVACVAVAAGVVVAQDAYSPQAPAEQVDLIFKAASTGDIKTLMPALQANENLANVRQADGKTPLHIACMVGKTKAAEVILNHGADINAKDKHKKTPMYYAAKGHWWDTYNMLKKRGGKIR